MHLLKKIVAPTITLIVLLGAEAVILWLMAKPDYRNETWPLWVGVLGIFLVGFEFWVIAKNTRREIELRREEQEKAKRKAKDKAVQPVSLPRLPQVELERISPTRRFIEAAGDATPLPKPKAFPSPKKEDAKPIVQVSTPRRQRDPEPPPKKCVVTERAKRDSREVQRALDEAYLSFE